MSEFQQHFLPQTSGPWEEWWAGAPHQLENPKGQILPTGGPSMASCQESHVAENLPEHFTPHSQSGISVGKCCLGLIKSINKCERRRASSLPRFSRRWRGGSPANSWQPEQTPGDGEGEGSLARCRPWGRKESGTTW